MSRPRPSLRRSLQVLLGVALVVALGGVGTAIVLDRMVDRQSVDGLTSPDASVDVPDADGAADDQAELPDEPEDVRYVLVAGLDDRSVLTPEERVELSTGNVEGARTEAIALVRLDPDRDQLDVLRFPRDLLVTRCDGSRGRINAAYDIGERAETGGIDCLVETITSWTGLPIHHVVEVDFRGFVDLVDAVDGVTVELDEPLQDDKANLDVPAGQVELDGPTALAFVRARGMDSDLGRIERQQQLVAAALDQIVSRRTLSDPSRLTALVRASQRHLTFDDGMSPRRLLQFGQLAAGFDADDMVTRTVTGEVDETEGFWFLVPDELAAQELFADLRDGGFSPQTQLASDGDTSETGDGTGSTDGTDVGSGGTDGSDGMVSDGEAPSRSLLPGDRPGSRGGSIPR